MIGSSSTTPSHCMSSSVATNAATYVKVQLLMKSRSNPTKMKMILALILSQHTE
jgi:hypothetical protein